MASPASPQSFNSSDTTSSSSWSNPQSSLLETNSEDASGVVGRHSSNESGFTNPSSFGSMFALIQNSNVSNNNNDNNNNNNYNNAPGQSSPSRAAQRNDRLTNSAYEAGNSLARLAWLEMDADVEALESSNTASNSLDWSHKPVTPFQHSHTTFPNCPTYTCARCGTTLALQDELISKAFSGRDGKAFLFFSVLNIKVGAKEDRQLLTGLHTVADLNCVTCQRSVGWCYLRAFEASQRYKEGKFILERATLQKTNNWQLEM